eukprot:gnl/Chilomastix_cuspidata/1365.p1 GENE.gnl/Chilomastix_cuspidata/1365~~gnl/Chilomastix_cuspidata/1365.p1  ORF type:complete len:668 (-),score=242.16 gnl/Chilomastix_cuspidata/1365:12-1976(-)
MEINFEAQPVAEPKAPPLKQAEASKPSGRRAIAREQKRRAFRASIDTETQERYAKTVFKRELLEEADKALSTSHATGEQSADSLFTKVTFAELGAHTRLVRSLERMEMTTATAIQKLSFGPIVNGKNVVARSQTGSGKTLAFLVPLLSRLLGSGERISRADGTRCIILSPTRELVTQTTDVIEELTRPFPYIVPVALCGGERRDREKARLRKGATIIVGTPGRVLDHLRNTASLQSGMAPMQFLVFDECDTTLAMNMGELVRDAWHQIEAASERELQVLLFSATASEEVLSLATAMRDPVFVSAVDEAGNEHQHISIPATLRQEYIVTPPKIRLPTLLAAMHGQKSLVFVQSRDEAVFLETLFAGVPGAPRCFSLHGGMTQPDRRDVITRARRLFKSDDEDARAVVVFSTDVAARGLDLPGLSTVIQFVPPTERVQYVHRIGRTARIGRDGSSLLFLLPSEADFVRHLSEFGAVPQPVALERVLGELRAIPEFEPGEGARRFRGVLDYASRAQTFIEGAVAENAQLQDRATRAFQSFINGYGVRERALRAVFNPRLLHFGHMAKSFALRDTPGALLQKRIKGAGKQKGRITPRPTAKRAGPKHKKDLPSRTRRQRLSTKVSAAQGRDTRIVGTGQARETKSRPPASKRRPPHRK